MKKLNRSLSFGVLVVASFLTAACGKAPNHYSTKGPIASGQVATNQTATAVQGLWTNCTGGILTTYSFTGNGYWTEADTYTSSDCSDSQASSLGTPEEGTFQLAGAAAQAGYAQTATFTPYNAATDSDGAVQTGAIAVIGTNLEIIVLKNGSQVTLTYTTNN